MSLADKGIIIRKTTESDLKQIFDAGTGEPLFSGIQPAFNAENLADIFASDISICCSAVQKKKVLGFIIGSIDTRASQIFWIMTKEKFRNTGIGKEMLQKYIEVSKKYGAEKFVIYAIKNSAESIKFFTDSGFNVKENFIELHKNA